MPKQSESFQRAKRPATKQVRIPAELMAELAALEQMPDGQIDLTDIPEVKNWAHAVAGKYYRPIKKPVSIRIDADVLDWFKSAGKGYQSTINEVLRQYVVASMRVARKKASCRTASVKRSTLK
jgi:uncharacterized protein (DUF4415 family)